ncbi:MAG: hypothetical protein KDE47_13810 [Caldilineaceae bacterium]|nr:hypothetical protein [Caldilineaceae bacterium]
MERILRSFAICLLVIGVLAPLAPQLLWSFAFGWFFPALLPQRWELQAWRYLFSASSRVGEALLTSLMLAAFVVLLAMLIGLPAGRALGLYQFRGKRLVN